VRAAPGVIRKVEPEYTEEARAAKLQGTVVLKVRIEPDGLIGRDSATVVRGLGMGLDEKAIDAVLLWQFKPSYRDGGPEAVWATIEVAFRLADR